MSNLLLNEQPLLVMPELATKIGLNESIVLQQIHYWTNINEKAKKNYRDGFYWTYNTLKQWQEQFPFWSECTIQRTIAKLEKLGLVVSANHNKMKIDRTKWYRIDYKALEKLESLPLYQIDKMDISNCEHGHSKLIRPIPETSTETSPKTNTYAILPNGDCFFDFYLQELKRTGRKHPRVTPDQLKEIEKVLDVLHCELEQEPYEEGVIEYFDSLPESNNGNFLSFIKAIRRLYCFSLVGLCY